jgi:hypothetical protein
MVEIAARTKTLTSSPSQAERYQIEAQFGHDVQVERINRIVKFQFHFCHRPSRRNGVVSYGNDAISPRE